MLRSWDNGVEEALQKLEHLQLLRSLRPIYLQNGPTQEAQNPVDDEFHVFDEMQPWDRSSVEVHIPEPTFQKWLHDIPSSGDEEGTHKFRKLLLFSGNDYLGLSSHPTIGKAASKAALEHGMGPRGSALICGYTDYHRRLESCIAELKKKEDCLLCPTGFAANMALMVALGNVGSLLAAGKTPLTNEKIAIFSDALNHASIIDGIRLAERQKSVEIFIYRHCDMTHLNALLSSCTMRKKVVVTDSLFSMDGDFAPMIELVKLRKEHGFLLVIDDAHGTFVCGKNGGGVAEQYNCERDVDICVGTLSKAAGCHGGFIACSKRWKQLIQSRGRSFIFSTATPIPIVAAARASLIVARKETWRRREIWNRVQDFRVLTGIPINSPIISLIVGSEEKALQASQSLLKSGFHVTAIRPPTVPPNSCRLRVTLSATHTRDDIERFTAALSLCVNFQEIGIHGSNGGYARL
ncbi:PREDICTED: 8-amino-7-oxononanoate [Prunus dulcis]|uniref:PREDICTED: 8-amino-7-oxononanoate n=1 Tax=Prunus dulcis TaxID=3755 RepID=A0A5E4E7E0_PRUDU|nr:8-amino-7-oxononanoate synthase [Prunus dulcis]VVA10899.1 PREDICTED: 8-amino-7-oxononanoate [Prunus dulcis]